MKSFVYVVALLSSATIALGGGTMLLEVAPGSMLCSSLEATTQRPIETATAHGGGILFDAATSAGLTTERCIANLGHLVSRKPTLRAPLHCNDAAGELVYYGIATTLALSQGVWTWTEEGTGDSYIATMECTATGVE